MTTGLRPSSDQGAKAYICRIHLREVKRIGEAEQMCAMMHSATESLGIHKRSQIRHYGLSLSYNAKGKANELKTEFERVYQSRIWHK